MMSYFAHVDSNVPVNTNFSQQLQRFIGYSGNNFGQGRSRGKNLTKPKVVCQLCGKNRHSALHSYNSFDITFREYMPP